MSCGRSNGQLVSTPAATNLSTSPTLPNSDHYLSLSSLNRPCKLSSWFILMPNRLKLPPLLPPPLLPPLRLPSPSLLLRLLLLSPLRSLLRSLRPRRRRSPSKLPRLNLPSLRRKRRPRSPRRSRRSNLLSLLMPSLTRKPVRTRNFAAGALLMRQFQSRSNF